MIEQLKFLLFRRPALARKGVRAERTAYCDKQSECEGNNRISAKVRLINSRLGMGSYVADGTVLIKTLIGRFSCIGPNVTTVVGAHPTSNFASIHPAFFSTSRPAGFTFSSCDLYPELGTTRHGGDFLFEIGSDVWVGHGALIMQGVKIGHGAIVAAGSVVTKDVPPYAIVAGVPARLLRYRFPEETIRRLLATAWWNLEFEDIARLAPQFASANALLATLESTACQPQIDASNRALARAAEILHK